MKRWRYNEPQRGDFDTEDEYEEAMKSYESALYDYCEMYLEEDRD